VREPLVGAVLLQQLEVVEPRSLVLELRLRVPDAPLPRHRVLLLLLWRRVELIPAHVHGRHRLLGVDPQPLGLQHRVVGKVWLGGGEVGEGVRPRRERLQLLRDQPLHLGTHRGFVVLAVDVGQRVDLDARCAEHGRRIVGGASFHCNAAGE